MPWQWLSFFCARKKVIIPTNNVECEKVWSIGIKPNKYKINEQQVKNKSFKFFICGIVLQSRLLRYFSILSFLHIIYFYVHFELYILIGLQKVFLKVCRKCKKIVENFDLRITGHFIQSPTEIAPRKTTNIMVTH